MKTVLLLLLPVIFLTACDTTRPIHRYPYSGRTVVRADHGFGIGVNRSGHYPSRYNNYGRTGYSGYYPGYRGYNDSHDHCYSGPIRRRYY